MNIGRGLDTSMYSNSGGRRGSIGEVLGAVQGVMSIVGKSKERAKEQKELEQNDFLNTTFGNHLTGWDGKDQEDFKARTNSAMTEVLTEDPALYKKTTSFIADAAKSVYDAQDQQKQLEEKDLSIAGKKLENEGKETANKGSVYDAESKRVALAKSDFDYQNGVDNFIGYNLDDVVDQKSLDSFFLKTQYKRNISPDMLKRIPKNYQELEPNKKYFVDQFLSGEERRKKEFEDLKAQGENVDLGKKKSDAKIAGVNADYIGREKEQDLRKGEADILKSQREANKPEPSAMDGIDPETGKPYTQMQNKAAVFAVSMGRGIKNIDTLIANGFDEADFTGQVLNTFKKKKELSRFEFLNLAKTPQQRMYLQAQLDFMVPHLRDQSGAVINADEYTTEAAQFFPRPHETLPEVEQKRNARLQEFVARRTVGGSRYNQILKDFDQEVESRKKPDAAPNVIKSKSGNTYTF